jgi:signal transduction histidine kinase
MSAGRSTYSKTVLSADSWGDPAPYAGPVVTEALRQVLGEPRVPNAPAHAWRDWLIVGTCVPIAILEVAFRHDLSWKPIALILGVVPLVALLWRRTNPLAVVAVAFGAHAASETFVSLGAAHSGLLYVSGALILVPYALTRWGSGREVAIGLAIILVGHLPKGPSAVEALRDIAGVIIVLLFPAAVGAAMRYRTSAKVREIDQIKMREREQLARELHDTVAHHVSAIIIQAQAGSAVAASNPVAAANVLAAIEQEASKTLVEMRAMVGALRHGEAAELSPQRSVADITALARNAGESPHVDVRLSGLLDDLRPSVGSALYRLAQESITNAIRHARHATRIDVSVAGDDECVRLTVHDDGDPNAYGASSSVGFGIVGMAERVKLLGGTLEAGPGPDRGWTITAVLPRYGSVT